jgi:hypothetical protein
MNERDTVGAQKSEGSDYLSEIIKSAISSSDGSNRAASRPETNDEPRTVTHIPNSDIFSSLLSSPELLSKIPTIIATLKPILELLGNAPKTEASEPSLPASSSPTDPRGQKNSAISDRHSALLCAMKPYLSPERQQAIDYIIKLGRLGDILKTL